jgi:hypothetical protein
MLSNDASNVFQGSCVLTVAPITAFDVSGAGTGNRRRYLLICCGRRPKFGRHRSCLSKSYRRQGAASRSEAITGQFPNDPDSGSSLGVDHANLRCRRRGVALVSVRGRTPVSA